MARQRTPKVLILRLSALHFKSCITKYVDIIKDKLDTLGYSEKSIGTLVDKSEYHLESTWAKFFPTAPKWLLDSRKILGDVNGDGIVNITDVTDIHKHLAEIKTFLSDGFELAYFNKDYIVDIADATAVQPHLAELE